MLPHLDPAAVLNAITAEIRFGYSTITDDPNTRAIAAACLRYHAGMAWEDIASELGYVHASAPLNAARRIEPGCGSFEAYQRVNARLTRLREQVAPAGAAT